MKNIFKFLVVMILALSLLASCTAPDGSNSGNNGGQTGGQTGGNGDNTGDTGDSGDNSGDEGDEGEDDVVIEDKYADSVSGDFEGWLANDNVYLCSESNIPADQLVEQFKNNTNVALKTTVAGEHDKLFMLGEIDHDLSAYAYERLDVLVSDDPNNTIFVICTDGTSVAIAYNSLVARYRALEYFFEEYNNLDLTKGGVISHKGDDETKAYLEFDTIEYVDETRAALRNETFAELGNTFDAEAIAQLRLVYDMYDSDVYSWLANLYDNGIGAFYYANASRTYKGFLPDLESTAQALLFLKNSGMISHYGNSFANALPEEMKDAIVAFTKGLQDSEDGYFYHPQWGKEISGTRKGRDLGWVRDILGSNGFNVKPYWDVPNGMEGEIGAPGASATASVLTANLNTSTAVAVSKVVAVSTTPEEDAAALESAENLITFLQTHSDFKRGSGETATFNSYTAGNWIESNLGQIQNKGFGDELIVYLDSIYNSETGLWEDDVNYGSVNGLMKLSVVYKSLKANVPNPEKSLESAIEVLTSEAAPEHVCSVYNPWAAIANLISSLSDDDKATLRAELIADAENLIGITYEKLSVFQRDDGGFSYYPKYSSPSSQGSLVTLEKQKESDVNATMICVNSTMTAMFGAMGITEAPRYYPVDFALFSDVLNSLEPPIKKEIPAAEPVTFEDFNEETSETEKGVVKYPVADIESVVTNVADTTVGADGNYKWFQNAVVQNPLVDDDTDLVLYTKVITEKVDGKIVSALNPSNTKFYIPNAGLSFLGNCFVYEADMYFKSNSVSETPLQIQFMSGKEVAAMLNFDYYKDDAGVQFVKIGEGYFGPDGVKNQNVAGDIRTDAWVKVRIELYKIYEAPESGSDLVFKPLIKIYVDNVFKGECDSVYGKNEGREPYDRNIHDVTLSFYRTTASEIYLNNVLVERCNKAYKWEPDPKPQIVPTPTGKIEAVEDFEDEKDEDGNVVTPATILTPTVQNKAWVKYFGKSTFFNATEDQTFNPYIAYSIAADPENAANQVLKVVISKDDAKDHKPSRTEVPLKDAEFNGTSYTFSADFYYESANVKDDMSQIFITNSSDKILYGLRITKASASGSVVINSYKYGTEYTSTQIVEGLEIGKWFNLKVVFTKTNDEATTKAEIYIDNVLKATDTNCNKDYALDPDINVNKAVISHYRLNTTTLYLDNISFARDGKLETSKAQDYKYKFLHDYVTSYLSSAEDAKTAGDFTYEEMNNITPTRFYIVDADNPTLAQNDESIVGKVDDIKNKCMRVVIKNFNASKNGHTYAHTDVKVSNDEPAGNCYTFESKIYHHTGASTAGKILKIADIQFKNADGGVVLSLDLAVAKGSTNIQITSNIAGTETTLYTAGTIENIAARNWFTVRAEYYHAGTSATASNTYLKLYINDTLVYQGVAYGDEANLATEISYASIIHKADVHDGTKVTGAVQTSVTLYDDIQLTRTENAYAEDAVTE